MWERGKYGVVFGNEGFPRSRGRGAKLPVCNSEWTLGGEWGKTRVCSVAGEKGWKWGNCITGDGFKQTRMATTAG